MNSVWGFDYVFRGIDYNGFDDILLIFKVYFV